MFARGMDLEDVLNFQALEWLEPSPERELVRYFGRVIYELHQVNLRLELLINPKAKPECQFKSLRDIFPVPLDVWEAEQDPVGTTERALERIRGKVAEKVKSIFFKKDKVDASKDRPARN